MPSSSSGLYQLDATGLTRRRAQRLNRSYTTPRGTTSGITKARFKKAYDTYVPEHLKAPRHRPRKAASD
jgi:hypothetical protein